MNEIAIVIEMFAKIKLIVGYRNHFLYRFELRYLERPRKVSFILLQNSALVNTYYDILSFNFLY